MKVKIYNSSNNPIPTYNNPPINGSVQDSGMDVYSNLSEVQDKYMFDTEWVDDSHSKLVIHPLGRVLIPTGLHIAPPLGYEFQIRDRSGHALKKGLILTNGIATIDAIYRGDYGVIISNISNKDVIIEDKERIAQIVLMKVECCEFEEVNSLEELGETDRGANGYNSSGVQ